MQLRYLDKDGYEKIRIDRDRINGSSFIVSKEKLQNKANRYYFADSKTKPLEKVWFSPLDLNMEQGKVQQPFNPTLRAMLPIKHNDQFAGILIVNYFMEDFLNNFVHLSLYDTILFDSKGNIFRHYDSSKNWSSYTQTKDSIKTLFPDYFTTILSDELTNTDQFVSNQLNLPLGNQLYLLLQIKEKYIKDEQIKLFKHYFIVGTFTFLISLIVATFIVRKFNTLIEKLDKKTIELANTNKNLEKFIDSQDNIVLLTDGKTAKFANKKFFDFLGFEDLKDFKEHHECICEFFMENDRFFHLGKIDEDQNWVDVMKTLPHSERIVSMLGADFIPHAFSISLNKFNDELLIISFSDISQTMLEHIHLEEKTIKDKFTGAYNREFFEQNIHNYITQYNSSSSKLAIALLDIDHFKSVNDNYGHDVGDAVLVQFVETVQRYSRQDDIFIRWGGEEFVLILKVKSSEDLQRALDHLRSAIEIQEFPTVGKKTCSIGGTLFQEGEDILTTIKRADEGTYEAKENGRNMVVIKQ